MSGPWSEKLILVGGLVPSLLFDNADHVGTTDIDLVLNPVDVEDVESYRTLEQNFKKIGLRGGANPDGQAQHFRWTITDDQGNEEASLDLLCPSSDGDFAACRSPKTQHVDHSKRGKSITHFAGSRSLVSDEVDQ
ncbi:MAG: hypothetical protein WC314_28150 [Vulcanimicrobiota bacterium]